MGRRGRKDLLRIFLHGWWWNPEALPQGQAKRVNLHIGAVGRRFERLDMNDLEMDSM